LALTPGTRLGVYDVTAQIGEGGMGQVYRATDTRLKRQVAIKILPPSLAADPDRLARFQREAEVLASVNHPNIAAIYGLEDADGVKALVMELVEGEDLSKRIASGAIPLDEALPIARQIAEALEAAHEQGVIHRDLKPANVKVREDGTVKVLDFGLAKAREADAGGVDLSNSPTMMATSPGMILGTAAYMSPEQAKGRRADRSSDVWAFGCVLYQMLTGHRLFEGDTVSDILAAVLRAEPDWHRLPAETPEGIRRLLRRTLQKDHKLRFRDIRDARLEIVEALSGPPPEQQVKISTGRRERLAWAVALALVTLIAVVMSVRARRPLPTAPEVRLDINAPPTPYPSLAVSPDGFKIVFSARSAGGSQLWLRSLDSASARPLSGTEGAELPFWSADSRSIGFFADNRLRRMDIDDGSLQTLASSAPRPLGGAWNRDGTIVFSSNPGRPIVRISDKGGEPVAATRFESPQQRSQSSPQFLPDGRHFLFFVIGSPEARGVYVGQLDSETTKRLFDADAPAVYTATGQLLFVRQGKLLAQDFDPVRLELQGQPFPFADNANEGTALSASAAGPIVYRTPSPDSGQRQLVWVDRSGREVEKVVYPDSASTCPALSPDGRRVANFRFANGNMDIWSYETARRAWERITFDAGDDIFPLWSPDGSRIAFGSRRSGSMNLYWKLVGGPPGSEEPLLSTPDVKFPMDWSRDGKLLLYNVLDPQRGADIWALPLNGDRKPFEVVRTDFNERLPQFSPDGKWIAYESDKTGRFEIYVQRFPGPGGDLSVSAGGGTQVRWNPTGKELFYVDADDRLMAVPLGFSSDGVSVEPGPPRPLFATNVGSSAFNNNRQQYMVSPDGQSFVMNSVSEETLAAPITVILNWKGIPR
jgi:eukaryotic-like serine/threonine-protein kinase